MIVTSIIPFDKRRSKVFLEEDFALVLYKGELRRYHLTEGSEITQEQYQEILDTILNKRARERALYLLKSSDKTEQEIRRKLKEGFYPTSVIDVTINFLKEYGFVDDEHYAIRYMEAYGSRKSRRQIQFELQQKGIPRERLSVLLEECPIEEESQIKKFLQKKHYDKETATPKECSKLVAALGRKGFSFELIRKMMDADVF